MNSPLSEKMRIAASQELAASSHSLPDYKAMEDRFRNFLHSGRPQLDAALSRLRAPVELPKTKGIRGWLVRVVIRFQLWFFGWFLDALRIRDEVLIALADVLIRNIDSRRQSESEQLLRRVEELERRLGVIPTDA